MSAAINRRRDTYRLLWRWHFYAGLLCLPFVLWLATTGMIYLFKPQLEPLLERRYAQVTTQAAQPASMQIEAALKAVPGSVLNAYQLPLSPYAATRVLVGKGSEVIRVFVNPTTLQVLGVVGENDRFMKVIFYLHGELLLGPNGSLLVELAASWTILMLITGLYLWWPRQGRLGGTLYPRLRQGSRVFWRDLHAVTGVWVSLCALFLLLSGLPWSHFWGGMLADARKAYAHHASSQDWSTSSATDRAVAKAQNTQNAMASMPGMDMGDMPGMTMPAMHTMPYAAIDRLLPAVRAQQLAAPVLIAPPSQQNSQWTARSDADDRPRRATVTLDADTGQVIKRSNFRDKPLLDRIIGYGIAIHEGALFPPLNQLFGVCTALGLILMCISAVAMWWRRRPQGTLGALPLGDGARYPVLVVALLIALGVLLPLLGASLVIMLALERWLLRRHAPTRSFLGLNATASKP